MSISARLDRLPISRYHYGILFMLAIGIFFDGVDNFMLSGIVAALPKVGFAPADAVAHLVSFTFLGYFIGAVTSGWLSDRYGRRTMFVWNMLIFSLGSLACAIAPNYPVLVALRLIASIGIGGEVVAVFTYFNEVIPPQKRGTWIGVLYFTNTISLPLTSFIGMWVIPMGVDGWRWMFVIGGVPAFFTYFIRRGMPESPRWYAANGCAAEAERMMSKIEADIEQRSGRKLPAAASTGAPVTLEIESFGVLFNQTLLGRTLLAIVIYVAVSVVAYSFLTWLPTMLTKQGLDISRSLGYTTIMVLGNPVGSFIAIALSDRISRKWATVVIAALAAIAAFAYAVTSDINMLLVLGFFLAAFTSSLCAITWYTYVPEVFPTAVRARGMGISGAFGRLATAASPYMVVAIVAGYGFPGVMMTIAGLFVLIMLVTAGLGVETKDKPLEEINEKVLASVKPATQT